MHAEPAGAIVVMKPPYRLPAALIERHVEHYAMLGFERCVHLSPSGT